MDRQGGGLMGRWLDEDEATMVYQLQQETWRGASPRSRYQGAQQREKPVVLLCYLHGRIWIRLRKPKTEFQR